MLADLTYPTPVLENISYLPLIMKPVLPPGAFSKSSPSNGNTCASSSPTLDWADSSDATSYEFCYDTIVNNSCSGNWISTGSTSQVGLSGLGNGISYEWQVRAINSGGTTYADGGTMWNFTTLTPGAWCTIMSENFEGSFPSGWTVADRYSGYGEYYPAKRNCRPHSGSYSGWLVGGGAQGSGLGCGANYPDNAYAWMVYGPFSTVGATAGQLNFYHWTKTATSYDRFCAWASSDEDYFYGTCFYGTWPWSSYSLDLANAYGHNYLGLSKVWVAFTLDTSGVVNTNEGAYVDDIVLRKCITGSCTGAPPLYSVGGNLLDELSYFLDPFVVQFSFPASGVLGEK